MAPNNASAWNYLRGVLELSKTPFSSLTSFVLPYTRSRGQESDEGQIIDSDNPLPSSSSDLPAPAALEFIADVYEREAEGLRTSDEDGEKQPTFADRLRAQKRSEGGTDEDDDANTRMNISEQEGWWNFVLGGKVLL